MDSVRRVAVVGETSQQHQHAGHAQGHNHSQSEAKNSRPLYKSRHHVDRKDALKRLQTGDVASVLWQMRHPLKKKKLHMERKPLTKLLTNSIALRRKVKIGTRSLSPRRTDLDLSEILKPYYMEEEEFDSQGRLVRSKSPRKFLESFNPIPSGEQLRKLNFYFYPYNRAVLTQSSMQFQRDEKKELLQRLSKLKRDRKLGEEAKDVIETCYEQIQDGTIPIYEDSNPWKHLFSLICARGQLSERKRTLILDQLYKRNDAFIKIIKQSMAKKKDDANLWAQLDRDEIYLLSNQKGAGKKEEVFAQLIGNKRGNKDPDGQSRASGESESPEGKEEKSEESPTAAQDTPEETGEKEADQVEESGQQKDLTNTQDDTVCETLSNNSSERFRRGTMRILEQERKHK